MNTQEIRDAIAASAELQALGTEHGAIAAALSVGRTKPVSKLISARGLAAGYPGGPVAAEAVLMKLETTATTMLASGDQTTQVLGSLIKRQLGFLAADGLDFGNAALRSMFDQFAASGVLTATEADNLKNLAVEPDVVTVQQVIDAMRGV